MMEFGDPVHLVGITVFISIISILIGIQLVSMSENGQKNTN